MPVEFFIAIRFSSSNPRYRLVIIPVFKLAHIWRADVYRRTYNTRISHIVIAVVPAADSTRNDVKRFAELVLEQLYKMTTRKSNKRRRRRRHGRFERSFRRSIFGKQVFAAPNPVHPHTRTPDVFYFFFFTFFFFYFYFRSHTHTHTPVESSANISLPGACTRTTI